MVHRSPRNIPVLTYHSLSAGAGPTCIRPEIFVEQLDALQEAGFKTVSLTDIVAWQREERSLPSRCVAITFDDGYTDFVTHALPELRARNLKATVFVPAGKVGERNDWEALTQGGGTRSLMTWQELEQLPPEHVEIGGHGMTHRSLAALPLTEATAEIDCAQRILAERLNRPIETFAPPFGTSNPALREIIRRYYSVSVGTRLNTVHVPDDPFDLPRIEMYYFQNRAIWRAFLAGKADTYLFVRRSLRAVRSLFASRPTATPSPRGTAQLGPRSPLS